MPIISTPKAPDVILKGGKEEPAELQVKFNKRSIGLTVTLTHDNKAKKKRKNWFLSEELQSKLLFMHVREHQFNLKGEAIFFVGKQFLVSKFYGEK